MTTALALFAGASLSFIPLGVLMRRLITDSPRTLDMPPMPSGSLEGQR